MVTIIGNEHGVLKLKSWTRLCISHYTNTLGIGVNPILPPPDKGK